MTRSSWAWLPITTLLVGLVNAGCGGSVETTATDGGGGGTPMPALHSCTAGRVGADHTCGLHADQDCCAASAIPGGTYNRLNNAKWPATVS